MGYALQRSKVQRCSKSNIDKRLSRHGKAYGTDTYFVNTTKEMKEKIWNFYDDMD